MTDVIRVTLRHLSQDEGLYPRYDEEAKILEVGRRNAGEFPQGVNIGELVLDLDNDGILLNFDLLRPRDYWRITEPVPVPVVSRFASIEFSREAIERQDYHDVDFQISTDADHSYVCISFGQPEDEPDAIGLSEKCIAFLENDCLIGFYVDLT